MKNTGFTLIIVVAVLAVLAGSFYMFKKDKMKASVDITTQTESEVNDKSMEEYEATPTPTGAKPGTSTDVDIDAELKSLDKEMGSAWEKDSDSDPTLEIQ